MSQSTQPLEYAEYAITVGAGIGLITAIVTSNWLIAVVPLALALGLSVFNRYHSDQNYRKRFVKMNHDLQLQYEQLQQEIVQSRSFSTALVKQTLATQKAELPAASGEPFNLQVLEKQVVDQQRLMTSFQNHIVGVEGTITNLVEALDGAAIPDRVEYLEQAIVKLSEKAGINPSEILHPPVGSPTAVAATATSHETNAVMFSLDDLGLDDPDPSISFGFDFEQPERTRLQGSDSDSGFFSRPNNSSGALSIDKIAADLISGDLLGSDPISGDLASGDLGQNDLLQRPAWSLQTTLKAHTDWVRCLSFTPDTHTLISGSFDQSIKFWNLDSHQLIHDLKDHHKGVFALAVSADGRTLASGSWDETIKLWDIHSGQLITNLEGHTASVRSLAMSPDNQLLISGSFDNSIRVWQLASGDLLTTMSQSEPIAAIALDHTGQILASTGDDGLVRLWSISTGQVIAQLTGNNNCICSLAISPSSDSIVAGTVSGSIVIWAINPQDVKSSNPLQKFKAHSGQINACVFHPDGQSLVTGSVDGKARIWAKETGKNFREKPRKTLRGEPGRSVMSTAISADGRSIAIGGADGSIELWRS
jgi:WD40 repeat protein